jgi:hypothetical protein
MSGAQVLRLVHPPARGGRTVAEQGFDVFWAFYPRKVARKAALARWARLRPAERGEALRVVEQFARHWAALREAGKDLEFCPHAATWLAQARWEDAAEWTAAARKVATRLDGRTPMDVAALMQQMEG